MLKRINESVIRKIIKTKLIENYKKKLLKEEEEVDDVVGEEQDDTATSVADQQQDSTDNQLNEFLNSSNTDKSVYLNKEIAGVIENYLKVDDDIANKNLSYRDNIIKGDAKSNLFDADPTLILKTSELQSSHFDGGRHKIIMIKKSNNNIYDELQKKFAQFEGYTYDSDLVNYYTEYDSVTLFGAEKKNFFDAKAIIIFTESDLYKKLIDVSAVFKYLDDEYVNNNKDYIANNNPQTQNQNQNNVTVESNELPVLFRIPQLNGGYFELAKILLNPQLMNALQDTSKSTKKFEQILAKKGIKKFGPITENKDLISKITDYLTNPQNEILVGLYNNDKNSDKLQPTIDKLKNVNNLGKYLAAFYGNQMFKVSQYIVISRTLFRYLYCIADSDKEWTDKSLQEAKEKGLNKVLKSNINVSDALSKITELEDAANISLEKMFKDRAAKKTSNNQLQTNSNKPNTKTIQLNQSK